MNAVIATPLAQEIQHSLSRFDYSMCMTCGACSSGCPATGLEGMDPRKLLRMAALGMEKEIMSTPWVWMCTMCFRCLKVCPMQVNIPALVYELRASWPRDKKPKGIIGSCNQGLNTEGASAVGLSSKDFQFVVQDVLEEVRETQPRFRELQAPIDKKGAFFFVNQNSREPMQEPDEMVPLWKILHLAGADWTYGTVGWGAENYCMFAAEDDHWREVLEKQVAGVKKLGCSSWINIECGHSFYSIWAGLQRFNIDSGVAFDHVVNWYARWIQEGKLRPSSDWNKKLGLRFTVQDPCMAVRKSMGDPFADALRFVVKACVGEENFVDMWPNKSNNYCCGGGGGFLQSGYKDARLEYGRVKVGQIRATQADYVITPCHNCHAQIEELSHHYQGGWKTVHLWTMLCLSLGVLGENERSYLGEDLASVGL